MSILLIGLNHKTASVDIRQNIAFDQQATSQALKFFKEKYPAVEFVLVSTCNRVELYAAYEGKVSPKKLALDIAELRGADLAQFKKHLYVMRSEKAVRHLLTVTASLDSMVVGENQIRAQVKESYSLATGAQTTGKILNHLFHVAFATGKQVFTKTSIANRRVSVAGVAVELAKQLFDKICSAKIVVVGAGEMGELLIDHFKHIKCEDITVVNRTEQKACSVASRKNVKSAEWQRLDEELAGADIVVSSVSVDDGFLYSKKEFAGIISNRRGRAMLIIDIAVPRSMDPDISKYEDAYLYCIDDLSQVVEQNIKLRQEDIELAVEIICRATAEFMEWFSMIDIGPIIGQIKEAFDKIKQEQLCGFFAGSRAEADCKCEMDATVNRVVGKILHCVIKNIDHVAQSHGPDSAARFAKNILNDAENIVNENAGADESTP